MGPPGFVRARPLALAGMGPVALVALAHLGSLVFELVAADSAGSNQHRPVNGMSLTRIGGCRAAWEIALEPIGHRMIADGGSDSQSLARGDPAGEFGRVPRS